MATKTTRREMRDTCGCIIEYSWDDSVPLSLRVMTPLRGKIGDYCTAHAHAATAEQLCRMIWASDRKRLGLDAG